MISQIHTVSFQGIHACLVTVQVHLASGSLPSFTIVGLPDKAVNESRERIRSALHTLGLALPPKRITMNLSPADLQKEGNHYDLPLALGLMMAMEVISPDLLAGAIALGELGLDGSIKPVRGSLSSALLASREGRFLICPKECGGEAVWGSGESEVIAADHLTSLLQHLKGHSRLAPPQGIMAHASPYEGDMVDIHGQEVAKRALLIAASGRHNMIMVGPPGTGKSMLAMRMMSILPPLQAAEALEVTMIHSLSIKGHEGQALMGYRPFRHPHHSVSMAGLVGGGIKGSPGEISLAHQGVLFLDELPEFSPQAIDSLRQSLESREAVVSRANYRTTYPADFQLIAAMNPCRCGYFGQEARQCHKAPSCVTHYQRHLSGPFLDRMDLWVEVPTISPLSSPSVGQDSASLRRLVEQSWDFGAAQGWSRNPSVQELDALINASPGAKAILMKAVERWGLSARVYYRMMRVARSIASLEACDTLSAQHMAEALSFRFPYEHGQAPRNHSPYVPPNHTPVA